MMRSRQRGLAVSDRLGQAISTNADAIAFGYNNDIPVGAVGIGHPPKQGVAKPGPGVVGLIDLRRRREPDDRIALVEASIQSPMARLLPMMLPAGSVIGEDTDRGLSDLIGELKRTGESLIAGAYAGAVHNTAVFLAVGRDSGSGRMMLDGEDVAIVWPHAVDEPVFQRIEATIKKAVAATGGTYVPNPVSKSFLGGNLFTVHPLGGCGMGDDAGTGVVDHKCRVFDTTAGRASSAVHDGLYVCDASALPCPVGVHPLLTITAVAERAMLLFARDRGLKLDVAPRTDVAVEKIVAGPAPKRSWFGRS
jgi:cholesterol oxidase